MFRSDLVLVFQNSNTMSELSVQFTVPNNVSTLAMITGSNAFAVTPDQSLTLAQLISSKALNGLTPFEVIGYFNGVQTELNFPVIPGSTLFVVMFGDTTAFLHFSYDSQLK